MKNKRAFTLIELLVVVLIMGILTAVALPQYQKTLLKARFAHLVVYNDALVKAQKLYFWEHGNYADTLDQLDIRVTNSIDIECKALYGFDRHSQTTYCTLNARNGVGIAALMEDLETREKTCWTFKASNHRADTLCADYAQTVEWHNYCGADNCHVYTTK